MNKPNGAGFYDYEDVPRDLYEKEVATTYKNFEDYLHEKHVENYIGSLDDYPEAYKHWLLHLDTLIPYADAYGEIKKLEGLNMASNIIKASN